MSKEGGKKNPILSGIKAEISLSLKDFLMFFFLCCFILCQLSEASHKIAHATFKYLNLCSAVWPCVVTVSFSNIKMRRVSLGIWDRMLCLLPLPFFVPCCFHY